MKRLFALIAALVLSFGAGSLAESAEVTPAPAEEASAALEPAATPTIEPLPPFPAGKADIHVKEKDGGEFRPLPLSILQGGAKLIKFKYSKDITVYEDPTIRAEYHQVGGRSTWGVVYYFADITIRDPSQIRTALATGTDKFRRRYKKIVRAISTKLNAVVAINGDFFGGYSANAYVLRQGTLYQDLVEPNLDILLIDEDGDLHVLTADQDLASIDKTQVDGKKVINALQFGPALVVDGKPVEDEKLNDRAHSPREALPDMANQRMCIMQIDKLHYMVLTCAHYGLSLPRFRDLAMYVSNYQAKTVYTLDGGNSSQLVFLGKKRNNTDVGPDAEGERAVTDIIYFASAWFTRK